MTRFLLPALFLIAAVGLFFGYTETAFTEVRVLRAEAARFDEALERTRELEDIQDRLLGSYNSFSANDVERLRKLLPATADNIRLIIDVDTIASARGLQLRDIQFESLEADRDDEEDEASTSYRALRLSFSVTTSYENFLAFLESLESSLRLIDVSSLSFESVPDESSRPTYQMSIVTYWLE